MEDCIALAKFAGGSPLDYIKRPMVEMDDWIISMNNFHRKVEERRKEDNPQ
jgi:hypothetical protein